MGSHGAHIRKDDARTQRLRLMDAGEALFMLAYVVWLAATVSAKTSFLGVWLTSDIWKVVCYSCMILLAASEIVSLRGGTKWTAKTWVGLALLAVCCFSCYNCGRMTTFWSIPFIFCARNYRLEHIFKASVVTLAITASFIMTIAYQDLINNTVEQADGRLRHYLGFRYPLRPQMIALSVTGMILWVMRERRNALLSCVLVLMNTAMYCLTGSRLSFAFAILGIIVVYAVQPKARSRGGGNEAVERVASAIVPACFIVSAAFAILTCVFFDSDISWLAKLDSVMGHRPKYSQEVLSTFGISAFGQHVQMVGNSINLAGEHSTKGFFYADSLFIQLIMMYGVAMTIIYVGAMTMACRKRTLACDWVSVTLIVLMALHGIMDNLTFDLWLNPMLFIVSGLMSPPEADFYGDHDSMSG